MSHLSLKVAVRYVVAQDEVLEEAHEILEGALEEIDDCIEKLGAFLDYARPAQELLQIRDLEKPLGTLTQYHRILGLITRDLKKLEREKDLSRILREFHDDADTLGAWLNSDFPSAEDLVYEYFWDSPKGRRLADQVTMVEDYVNGMRTFYLEHR